MKSADTITAPPAGHNRSNSLILDAVGNLEGKVCDVADMAGIAVHLIEDVFCGDPETRSILTGGRENCYYLEEDSREQMMFAIYQVNSLVRDLKKAYYAAVHGEG